MAQDIAHQEAKDRDMPDNQSLHTKGENFIALL